MNNPTKRSIKRLSITILILGGLSVAFTYVQMFSQIGGNHINSINWNPDIRGWQIAIIAGRFIGIALLYAMCFIFLFRINRGLENGEIFPKSNISLIRWTALVTVLLTFVQSNFDAVVKGESALMLDSNTFLVPLIVLLFAGIYKMAYLAAKDSNLAI